MNASIDRQALSTPLYSAESRKPLFLFTYLPNTVCLTPLNMNARFLADLIQESDEPLTLTYEATALFLGEISREEN